MTSTYGDGGDGVTLVPGFVRGFRSWLLNLSAVGLRSITREWYWHRGENKATCRGESCECKTCREIPPYHAAPYPACSCGIYARYVDPNHGYAGIQGIIKATGNIVIGEVGFRAELAQIEALVVDPIARSWLFEVLQPPHLRQFIGPSLLRPQWAPVGRSMSVVDEAFGMLGEAYGVPIFNSVEEARAALPFPDLSELIKQKEEACQEANTATTK